MNLGKESETVEFKKSTSELKEGVISLASMLNKSGRGTLYFGVMNDGEVIGQQMGKDTERTISDAIHNFIEPSIIPTIETKTTPEGLEYIEVKVEGMDSPYSAYGLYYARSADQDKKATREALKKMFVGSGFDFIRESAAARQDLHFTQLISLLVSKGYHISNEKTFAKNEKLLTDDGRYNQMAELLSDESDVSIKVARFPGKDKSSISQRTEFGNKCMILAMQQAMDYVQSIDETNVDISGPQRNDIPLFDFSAFREAWVNACLHNSWHDLTPPAIYIFSDRLEVVSYGGLPFGLSEEAFYQGDSHPVNKALQTIFTQLDYAEQTGHGVPIIVSAYGRKAFTISDNFLTVTIPYAFTPEWASGSSISEEAMLALTDTQKKILDCIKRNPKANAEEISKEIGMSLSTVKKSTAKLTEFGFITRKGSRRNGYWSIEGGK